MVNLKSVTSVLFIVNQVNLHIMKIAYAEVYGKNSSLPTLLYKQQAQHDASYSISPLNEE